MRDLFVTLFVLGMLPICFKRPLMGLLVFSALAYGRIQDLAWGFARYQRWSFFVAIAMLGGFIAMQDKKKPILEARTMLMAGLVLSIGLGHFFATGPGEIKIEPFIEYIKIIGIAVFTTSVVQTRTHLRMLVWVVALSFAFYGVKNGIAGIASGGNRRIGRGLGGMLEDNNDFALVILTYSRGAALSMSLGFLILVLRSRNRIGGFMIIGCCLIAGAAMVPEDYKDRINTLRDVEADGSARGRLRAWAVAGRMIKANPVFGVGFDRFRQNYLRYETNLSSRQLEGGGAGTRVAHNSYLQIWAECGTPAFFCYMCLIFLTLFDLQKIRKEAKRRYNASWILSYATMFEASTMTFVLGSLFLNRAHFDLMYHYTAMVLVFGRIARAEMEQVGKPQALSGQRGGSLIEVSRSGFGRRVRKVSGFRDTQLLRSEN